MLKSVFCPRTFLSFISYYKVELFCAVPPEFALYEYINSVDAVSVCQAGQRGKAFIGVFDQRACSVEQACYNITISMKHNYLAISNNNGADQSAQMRRLICAFVVLKQEQLVFL